MEIKVHDKGLLFCNGEIFGGGQVKLPILLENHTRFGKMKIFLDSGKLGYCEGCNVVLHGEIAWVYFHPPNRENAEKLEFVAKLRHLVQIHPCGVQIACENGEWECFNRNCKGCEVYNFGCEDYIFLQFEMFILVLYFDGLEYIQSEKIPCNSLQISQDVVAISFKLLSSGGLVLSCKLQTSEIKSAIFQNGGVGMFDFCHLENGENYIAETFPTYFFEIFMLAKFISHQQKTKLLAKYLQKELLENLQDVVDFFGNYCGIIPCNLGVVLVYPNTSGIFYCRKFHLETKSIRKTPTQNQPPNQNATKNVTKNAPKPLSQSPHKTAKYQIVNVQEVEEFQLPKVSQGEFNKIVWHF